MTPRFATFFDGRLANELDATGAGCERLGAVRISRPHTVVRARRRLADVLTTDRPDAVIAHAPWSYGVAAPVLRRLAIPAILWVHDRMSGRPWAERWAALTEPSAVISNSQFTAESIPQVFPRVMPSVVYAPVPAGDSISAEQRRRARAALGVSSDETCVVMTASRLERWKGHRELIDAIAPAPGDWRLWIAGAAQKTGEAEYLAELQALSAERGIADRVQFLGERRDVPQLLRAADVHCQPNHAPEPFGLVFVEALYAGLPSVTTSIGGAMEIVTPECGVLVENGDGAALRDALARLIADGAMRRTLGAAGPRRAAALCDPARQLSQLATVIGTVAA
jgi:glycosyltransferase involved in cell wall biosynthesis